MEFNGGGGIVGLNPNGFVPTNNVQQNQANLDYVNAVNQASLNPNTLYGPGGFGYQTDQYAAAGAAYGRATGGFNGPTYGPQQGPSYGTYGGDQGPPADRSTLDDAQQQYYDAHESRYGYAPPASFFSGSGPQSWNTMYGGGGVTGGGSASAEATTTAPPPGGSGIGPGSSGQVTGGGSNYADRSTLSDAQQQYYDAHVARYGYAPPASFFTGSGPQSWNTMYGGGASASAGASGVAAAPPGGSGIGPGASGQVTGGGSVNAGGAGNALYDSLSDAQQQYYNAHVARYGAPPPASFFTGNGPLSWNVMYGGGAKMEEAPPSSPGGLIPGGGGGGGAGYDPAFGTVGGSGGGSDPGYAGLTDAQQQYVQAHIARYGSPPPMSFFTGTGPLSWNSMYGGGGQPAPFQTATGNTGQSPGMSTGMGGFNNQPGDAVRSDLDPAQQQYYDAHVQRYGYAPPASFFTGSGPLSWNTMYGGGDKNVGDFQQEAINQGQQSMLTLQDQVNAALLPPAPAPTAPSDTLTDADRAIQPAVPDSGPGSGVDAINRAAGIDPSTGNEYPPGVDRNTGQPFGVPPPTPGGALPFNNPAISQISPSASSEVSGSPQQLWLAEQRAPIATSIANNPELLMEIAARIRTEDSNSPEGQQAVFEAMLNNQIATSFDAKGNPVKGVDMLGPAYYPKAGAPLQAYQDNLKLMQSNPAAFSQMKEIIAKVLQGSNVSQGAFGWSQGGSDQATSDLANANLVYTSPKTGSDYNVFYRPTGSSFGPGYIAGQNYWLSQMPPSQSMGSGVR